MKIKIVNNGFSLCGDALSIPSDVRIIHNIYDAMMGDKNNYYNKKWIVNCQDWTEFDFIKGFAEELRPKQLIIIDPNNNLNTDYFSEIVKSWRGTIINSDSELEILKKPDEGLFYNVPHDIKTLDCLLMDKRYRIEGREFVLCSNKYALGHIKIGLVSKMENGDYAYFIEKFEPFDSAKLLTIDNDNESLYPLNFIENIENYYFENYVDRMSDDELKSLSEEYKKGEKYATG